MPLLDNPLDTSLKGSLAGLDRLSQISRWGWSFGWGIPAVFVVGFSLTHDAGSAITLILVWFIGLFLTLLRMDGRSFGGSRTRVWLAWVILEYVMCAFVIIITMFPNP